MKNGVFSLVVFLLSQLCVQAAWHELLQNTNFETTSPVVWTTTVFSGGNASSSGIVNLGNAHAGSRYYAYVGDYDTSHFNAKGAIQQNVSLPTGTTQVELNFYLNVTSKEANSTAFDTMNAYLLSGANQVVNFYQWSNKDKDPNDNKTNYIEKGFTANIAFYAGRQLVLQFSGETDGNLSTTFRIDDVSLRAYVTDYTITASAGTGGSISPSGTTSAEYGQTLSFTAAPNVNYAVDVWTVNGKRVATNNANILLGVAGNTTVNVTFKKTAYDLNISTPHGTVQVAQNNQRGIQSKVYTPNSKLILTPVPDPGFVFCGWSGNISGLAQPFYLLMDNDKSITANFVPQVIQTEMAMSTPIMSIQSETPDPQFGFDMPTRSDWTYSVQVHRNGQAGFSYLTAFDGTGSSVHVADKNVKNYFASYYCVYAEPKPVSPIVPFLSFPMTNDNQAEMTAYSATATAVFDNDGVGDKANGWILLCTGQLLTFAQDRCVKLLNNQTVLSTSFSASDIVGYMMNSAGDDVVLPFFYNDLDGSLSPGLKGTIWYDGHTGYDYRVGPNTHVIAAAHGRVTGDSSFNHNTAFNQLVIECDNGYKTYYLHMNSWDQAFKEGDEIQEGQRIGVPGDIGANGEHTGAVHLHFTVKEPQTDKGFKRVDPYGLLAEDKTVVSPILWKKQPFN